MNACTLCPRNCRTDRSSSCGFCGAYDKPRIARIGLHHYEEPPISGFLGSGAVFFSGCNLRCVFCQNHELRDGRAGEVFDISRLADAFLHLQKQGAHNVNLVTPTPHIPAIAEALHLAKERGLKIPIVFNTNAYTSVSALLRLEGLIDIYLPDFKYKSAELALRFSSANAYFETAKAAISEMLRQVGNLKTDERGIALRGVLIRHLVLPGCAFDSRAIIAEIAASFGTDTHLSLMRQYAPLPDMPKPLNRRITDREYQSCIDACEAVGLKNVFIQGRDSASLEYTPAFFNSNVITE
ncbi:MAG: radical SAM protein [Clostridia bacterium]|nr:radical SAM protein [Clostridia bacterium]